MMKVSIPAVPCGMLRGTNRNEKVMPPIDLQDNA